MDFTIDPNFYFLFFLILLCASQSTPLPVLEHKNHPKVHSSLLPKMRTSPSLGREQIHQDGMFRPSHAMFCK